MSAAVYADTSALAKLLTNETESGALRTWLADSGGRIVINAIGSVELRRLALRLGSEYSFAVSRLLGRVGIIALNGETLDLASRMPPARLRTLDALHVASAGLLADLAHLVSYDARMIDAAREWGLPVATPGA